MKTHEIARLLAVLIGDHETSRQVHSSPVVTSSVATALTDIAGLLLRSPNIELADARLMKKTDELAVTLKALTSLSKYSKQQWVSIIEEFSLPIELNPRASTRDVVGKVLGYLEAHPEMLQTQRKRSTTTTKSTPSNLEDTLNKLINYK